MVVTKPIFKFIVNKGLKEFESHILRKTALVEFKLRPYDDNGAA